MVSTKPAKGMRDMLPSAVRQRDYVVDVVKRAYEAHGFEPLETPSMERLTTLLGKYGDEGDQLIFRVMKRGANLGRALAKENAGEDTLADLGLRYDLTVPLARVVAEYQNELPNVFKRYQIQPVWRADRPQRGRFREFWQCDVDVVGSDDPIAEAEVMSALATVLYELGFDNTYIRLNHRDLLFGLLDVAGVPEGKQVEAIVAIDKMDKVGWEGVASELTERGVEASVVEALDPLFNRVDAGREPNLVLDRVAAQLEGNDRGQAAVATLRQVVDLAAPTPAGPLVRVDPVLARGLSYYTGPVFEIASPDLNSSLGGGGRYDGLIGMFLGRDVPAVGFSLGLERICVIMEERGMFPSGQRAADLMIAQMDPSCRREVMALASELREAGLRVDVFAGSTRLGKQFKHADNAGIRHVAIVGPDEVAAGTVAIKDLESGQQESVPRAEVTTTLRG